MGICDAEQSDPDIPTATDSGSSYRPASSSPPSTDTDSGTGSPVNIAANKYVVFREQLDEPLKYCNRCGQTVTQKDTFTTGSMLSVQMECHAGHSYTWQSQPVVRKTPMGNVLISQNSHIKQSQTWQSAWCCSSSLNQYSTTTRKTSSFQLSREPGTSCDKGLSWR